MNVFLHLQLTAGDSLQLPVTGLPPGAHRGPGLPQEAGAAAVAPAAADRGWSLKHGLHARGHPGFRWRLGVRGAQKWAHHEVTK